MTNPAWTRGAFIRRGIDDPEPDYLPAGNPASYYRPLTNKEN